MVAARGSQGLWAVAGAEDHGSEVRSADTYCPTLTWLALSCSTVTWPLPIDLHTFLLVNVQNKFFCYTVRSFISVHLPVFSSFPTICTFHLQVYHFATKRPESGCFSYLDPPLWSLDCSTVWLEPVSNLPSDPPLPPQTLCSSHCARFPRCTDQFPALLIMLFYCKRKRYGQ